MYIASAVFAVLPLLAAAIPTPSSTKSSNTAYTTATASATPFTVMALRSASPIHFLQMNAANTSFWLGGATRSYCPIDASQCPPGNVTVFDGPNALSIEVPGGQQIYVAPSGALGFTQAHTANMPAGSVISPITYTPQTGTAYNGVISTSAFGATGFMACPTTTNNWQVYAAISNATVPTGNLADCLGFDAVTVDWTGANPEAWQYV
ncbi:putativebinding protein [Phaeomoniella chlamydospora]|uniref:Putativebinding protein n=1 Tax=Phaeomoniella chlamydospora TaxID=158046 RepID=A0A0G2DZI9_PHACM|nr:putativebinding protein [Phaeomoniella chlamydospora]